MSTRTVCPKTALVRYPQVAAQIDAEVMRREAAEDNPRKGATAQHCVHCSGWHVHIPTETRWKNRLRKQETKRIDKLNAERLGHGGDELPRTVAAVIRELPPVLRAEAWKALATASNHDTARRLINRWWELAMSWPADPGTGPEPLTDNQFRSNYPKVETDWLEAPRNETNLEETRQRRVDQRLSAGREYVAWLEAMLADERAYLDRLATSDPGTYGLPL